ncbi:hypothetical protein [Arthrobacter sp. GAS37]|uniref:hypothetical protein n=1 Tax=Arthrobacter sp. GAS37 TaxID=3156261 RepID=UPI00384FFD6B
MNVSEVTNPVNVTVPQPGGAFTVEQLKLYVSVIVWIVLPPTICKLVPEATAIVTPGVTKVRFAAVLFVVAVHTPLTQLEFEAIDPSSLMCMLGLSTGWEKVKVIVPRPEHCP